MQDRVHLSIVRHHRGSTGSPAPGRVVPYTISVMDYRLLVPHLCPVIRVSRAVLGSKICSFY